jgi:glutathione synthase/RimK-type ligase-like ATP-grasp enzyme
MNILIIAEKKRKIQQILDALNEKNAQADYMRISKITLVSRKGETKIKSLGKELPYYDAVFIHARTSLAQFVEPMLEELQKIGSYTNLKKNSYYLGSNEPYSFVALAEAKVPAPRTITTGSAKSLEGFAGKITYPILAKTFIGKKAHQELFINSAKELSLFSKSMRTEIDAFMIREFIEGDIVSCAVIGEKVFALKKKEGKEKFKKSSRGEVYKTTEKEKEIAINAANAIGYDTALVEMVKGNVIKVEPQIPFEEFNSALSETLQDYLALYLIEKAKEYAPNVKDAYDFLGIRKFLSKTFFGKWFK